MDKEILLQVPAMITKISTMSHGAVRLQVDTQENVELIVQAKIFGYFEKLGVFAFSKSEIKKDELIIPVYELGEDEKKTKSQVARNVLYLRWKQNGKKDLYGMECDAQRYYEQSMDKFINYHKEKLD